MDNNIYKSKEDILLEMENNFTIIDKQGQLYTVKDNDTGEVMTVDVEKYFNTTQKAGPIESILGIVFLIWFFVSIGLMVYLANVNKYYMAICLGQLFFIFGLVGFWKKAKIGIVFALVGLALVVIPILMMNPNLEINWDFVIPIIMLCIFLIVGIGLLLIPSIIYKKKDKEFSVSLMAKVVGLKETHGRSSKLYAPIYEYYYNNKTYRISSNTYTNINVPNVGDVVEIKINPQIPQEVYKPSDKKPVIIILGLMGIMFIVMSCLSLYLFIFKN